MGRQEFYQPLLGGKESVLGEQHVLDMVNCFRTMRMELGWRRGRKKVVWVVKEKAHKMVSQVCLQGG